MCRFKEATPRNCFLQNSHWNTFATAEHAINEKYEVWWKHTRTHWQTPSDTSPAPTVSFEGALPEKTKNHNVRLPYFWIVTELSERSGNKNLQQHISKIYLHAVLGYSLYVASLCAGTRTIRYLLLSVYILVHNSTNCNTYLFFCKTNVYKLIIDWLKRV